jgi:hypothetical protein
MLDEVTYICIRTHGTVIPNTEEKREKKQKIASDILSYLAVNPEELMVWKFNIACPGTTGLSQSDECIKASQILNPLQNTRKLSSASHITPKNMTDTLLSVYEGTIPERIETNRTNTLNQQKSEQATGIREEGARYQDTVSCPNYRPILETNVTDFENTNFVNTDFVNKMFLLEENLSIELYSIDILNGPFKGMNIISREFFENPAFNNLLHLSIPHRHEQNYADSKNWLIIDKVPRFLKQISLFELFVILKYIGLRNVYIIDPSCAVNYDAWSRGNSTVDRYMSRCIRRENFAKNEESVIIPVIFPIVRHSSRLQKLGGKTRKNRRKKYCSKTKKHHKKYKKNKTKRHYKK